MKFVFDLGNVMVYFQPEQYLRGLGIAEARIPELRRIVFGGPEWRAFDGGLMSKAEVRAVLCAAHPDMKDDILRALEHDEEMLQPIPGSVAALERLAREGYECYFLSNTNEEALMYMSSFDYFRLFRGGVASYKERLSKPDPAIFRMFAQRFGVEPAECVFVDDTLHNVEAARACGFDGRLLSDTEGLAALVEDAIQGR